MSAEHAHVISEAAAASQICTLQVLACLTNESPAFSKACTPDMPLLPPFPGPKAGLQHPFHVKAKNLRLGQLKRLTYHICIHSQKKESATRYHRQHACIADVPQSNICSSDETYAQHQPATAQLQQ
ncbi:MAG: hypothetical protein FRX49_12228 [Trebouxia sp. A1-2]|nr:MAG: hypothetical protein FRX49_12228 [Trebouxia sp. A1-2]